MKPLAPGWKLATDAPANSLNWDDGPGSVIVHRDVLIVNNWSEVRLHDLRDPRRLETVATWKPKERLGEMSLAGDRLFLFMDEGIEVVDLSTPAEPSRVRWIPFALGDNRRGDVHGDLLYFTWDDGIGCLEPDGKAKPEKIATVPARYFVGVDTDLRVWKDHLLVAGNDGLFTFQIDGPGKLTPGGTVKIGYTPPNLHLVPERELVLLVGNDNVVPIDVSKPGAPKRHKAIKVAGTEVGPCPWLDGDRLLVAAQNAKGRVAVVEIDLATEAIVQKSWLPDVPEKDTSSDATRGLAFSAGCVIAVTFTRKFVVCETTGDPIATSRASKPVAKPKKKAKR